MSGDRALLLCVCVCVYMFICACVCVVDYTPEYVMEILWLLYISFPIHSGNVTPVMQNTTAWISLVGMFCFAILALPLSDMIC